jgi:hypothetical protein
VQPIYLPNGQTGGWLSDQVIYDRNGQYRAFVENSGVFSFFARHLGYFTHNFFVDHLGFVVAFIDGATGGPFLPITDISPTPPVFPLPPLLPLPPIPPLSPALTGGWSQTSWDDFLVNT